MELLKDEELEQVVSGMFNFSARSMQMTYTHEDGSVTQHRILDLDRAWALSNFRHAEFVPEDEILQEMIQLKYIQS